MCKSPSPRPPTSPPSQPSPPSLPPTPPPPPSLPSPAPGPPLPPPPPLQCFDQDDLSLRADTTVTPHFDSNNEKYALSNMFDGGIGDGAYACAQDNGNQPRIMVEMPRPGPVTVTVTNADASYNFLTPFRLSTASGYDGSGAQECATFQDGEVGIGQEVVVPCNGTGAWIIIERLQTDRYPYYLCVGELEVCAPFSPPSSPPVPSRPSPPLLPSPAPPGPSSPGSSPLQCFVEADLSPHAHTTVTSHSASDNEKYALSNMFDGGIDDGAYACAQDNDGNQPRIMVEMPRPGPVTVTVTNADASYNFLTPFRLSTASGYDGSGAQECATFQDGEVGIGQEVVVPCNGTGAWIIIERLQTDRYPYYLCVGELEVCAPFLPPPPPSPPAPPPLDEVTLSVDAFLGFLEGARAGIDYGLAESLAVNRTLHPDAECLKADHHPSWGRDS